MYNSNKTDYNNATDISSLDDKTSKQFLNKFCRVWTNECESQIRLIEGFCNCDISYFCSDNGARFKLKIRLLNKKEKENFGFVI